MSCPWRHIIFGRIRYVVCCSKMLNMCAYACLGIAGRPSSLHGHHQDGLLHFACLQIQLLQLPYVSSSRSSTDPLSLRCNNTRSYLSLVAAPDEVPSVISCFLFISTVLVRVLVLNSFWSPSGTNTIAT